MAPRKKRHHRKGKPYYSLKVLGVELSLTTTPPPNSPGQCLGSFTVCRTVLHSYRCPFSDYLLVLRSSVCHRHGVPERPSVSKHQDCEAEWASVWGLDVPLSQPSSRSASGGVGKSLGKHNRVGRDGFKLNRPSWLLENLWLYSSVFIFFIA